MKGGEYHSPSCLKSSVKFPQSVMIWGAMSSAGVGPLCLKKKKTILLHPFTKTFWSTSCFLLLTSFLKMLISNFQQDLAPAHTVIMVLVCLTGQQTHQTWTPLRIYGILSRGKWETRDQKNADELKATVKETWASIPPQQCHKLITSMPRQIEAVIKAKGADTKYWVQYLVLYSILGTPPGVTIVWSPYRITPIHQLIALDTAPKSHCMCFTQTFARTILPLIFFCQRSRSTTRGAWRRTQHLVPYSENMGYASNPRRSLS